MSRMTLIHLLNKARDTLGPEALPGDLATWVMNEALSWPDAADVLMPALFSWVHAQERSRVRSTEQEAFAGATGPSGQQDPSGSRPADGKGPSSARKPGTTRPNPADEAMRRLLAERDYVPGHGMVPWGQMTASMHQLRADYVTRLRDNYVTGVNSSIRRHRLAAGLLDDSGCVDLDEYTQLYGELPDALTERAREEDDAIA